MVKYDYLKNEIDMKRIFVYTAIGGGGAAAAVFILLSVFATTTQNYGIDVDPIKDSQNLFTTARVTITDTGRLPLTNIVVNYGGNAIERFAVLSPGEKIMLSPPDNSPLKSVTVTADHGLSVTKSYRIPWKIPGMMGS